MVSVSISVDVPSLEEGLRFYAEALGFIKSAEPFPGVAVLRAGDAELLLLAKALTAGAKQEQLFENPGRPAVAFCSDPFGHGFCLIENRKRQG